MALFWTYAFSWMQSDRWLTADGLPWTPQLFSTFCQSEPAVCVIVKLCLGVLLTPWSPFTEVTQARFLFSNTGNGRYICAMLLKGEPLVLVIFIDGFFCKCEEKLWELANLNPWLPLSLSSGISYISVSALLQELAVLPVRTRSQTMSSQQRLSAPLPWGPGGCGPWSDCCGVIIFSGFVTLTFSEGRWR